VNVTFRAGSEGSVTADAPVVMLEHNKHILGALEDSQEVVLTNNGKYFNRKLQQQVFREALSPNGIRARFAQLKTTPDVSKIFWNKTDISDRKEIFGEKEIDAGNQSDSDAIFKMSDDEFTPTSKSAKSRKPYPTQSINSNPFETSVDPLSPPKLPDNSNDRPQSRHFNPWSAHLYNNHLAKLKEKEVEQTIQQFLLLEDLTEGLVFPCILDLKMGTRQHGVNATAEKKASQERKCERSTSKRLGVRICGMQVPFVHVAVQTRNEIFHILG
jgi:hypothetical protein